MSAVAESVVACPICHAEWPPDAAECPRCGEPYSPEVVPADFPPEEGLRTPGLREKFLYYAGIVMILLGGPGLALGSWLHDVLRISFLNYDAFDVFGPVNRLVLAVGLMVMIVGIVFLILSLRLSRPADAEPS